MRAIAGAAFVLSLAACADGTTQETQRSEPQAAASHRVAPQQAHLPQAPAPAAAGGVLRGTVTADGRPARARVELRRIRDTPGELPWYTDGLDAELAGRIAAVPAAAVDA